MASTDLTVKAAAQWDEAWEAAMSVDVDDDVTEEGPAMEADGNGEAKNDA